VRWQPVAIARPGLVVSRPGADLSGRRLKRAVAAGEMVSDDLLESIPAVKRGDDMVVQLNSASLQLTLEARALDDGAAGAMVRFRNPFTREVSRARVIAPGLAELVGPAGRVAGNAPGTPTRER
jgi:flagella basal body P-ring formation protein FlgA